MNHFEGVELEITSDGQILPLYDDPDAPDTRNPQERQRYIEATIGAKFEIKVTLTESFRFGESQVAVVSIAYDGERSFVLTIEKSSWLLSHKHKSLVFWGLTRFCPVTSTWKNSYFTFGSLDISNDPFLKPRKDKTDCHLLEESTSVEIDSAKSKKLGQIQVAIQRRNLKTRIYPRPHDTCQLDRVAEVSEKTLKGGAISSTVRQGFPSLKCYFRGSYHSSLTDGPPVAQPADITVDWVKIRGRLGEPASFILLYRSKRDSIDCCILDSFTNDPCRYLTNAWVPFAHPSTRSRTGPKHQQHDRNHFTRGEYIKGF